MSDYVADVAKYVDSVDETVVDNIVKYCGIALRSKDSSTVAATDKKELDTVKNGFAKKKLELSADDGDSRYRESMRDHERRSLKKAV